MQEKAWRLQLTKRNICFKYTLIFVKAKENYFLNKTNAIKLTS